MLGVVSRRINNKPDQGGLEALLLHEDWLADQQGRHRACYAPGVESARLARPPLRFVGCRCVDAAFEKRLKEAERGICRHRTGLTAP